MRQMLNLINILMKLLIRLILRVSRKSKISFTVDNIKWEKENNKKNGMMVIKAKKWEEKYKYFSVIKL